MVSKVVFLKLWLLAVDTIYYYQIDKKIKGLIPIFKRISMH
jgi:hypothetical protein